MLRGLHESAHVVAGFRIHGDLLRKNEQLDQLGLPEHRRAATIALTIETWRDSRASEIADTAAPRAGIGLHATLILGNGSAHIAIRSGAARRRPVMARVSASRTRPVR
jgi:hypothetical protein